MFWEAHPQACSEAGEAGWSEQLCSTSRGGLFDKDASSSCSKGQAPAILSLPEDVSKSSTKVTDTLKLTSNVSLPQFPVQIIRTGSIGNTISLGLNSRLLNTLVSARAIASRSWSFYHGWQGAELEHQKDGSLVLGGYDKSKITGRNITLPIKPVKDCDSGLVVAVSAITMSLQNGSNFDILGASSGDSLQACIAPCFTTTTLPSAVWESFLQFSGSVPASTDIGTFYNGLTKTIHADGAYV